MAGIRGKNTKPELLIRSLLHRRGFRFRLHAQNLPGKPDIVLARYHAVIFVNGCFRHGHAGGCCVFSSEFEKNAQAAYYENYRDYLFED